MYARTHLLRNVRYQNFFHHQVRGAGVIGEQPILNPGKSFEYTSGAPLRTTDGTMEGEYTVGLLDEASGEWKQGTLEVVVGRFLLTTDSPTAA